MKQFETKVVCLKDNLKTEMVPVNVTEVEGELRVNSLGCDNADGGAVCARCIAAVEAKACVYFGGEL